MTSEQGTPSNGTEVPEPRGQETDSDQISHPLEWKAWIDATRNVILRGMKLGHRNDKCLSRPNGGLGVAHACSMQPPTPTSAPFVQSFLLQWVCRHIAAPPGRSSSAIPHHATALLGHEPSRIRPLARGGRHLRNGSRQMQSLPPISLYADTHINKLVDTHGARCRILVLEDEEWNAGDAHALGSLVRLLDLEVACTACEPCETGVLRCEETMLDADLGQRVPFGQVHAFDVVQVEDVHSKRKLDGGVDLSRILGQPVREVRLGHGAVRFAIVSDVL